MEEKKKADVTKVWNRFISGLIQARNEWFRLQRMVASIKRKELDELPIEAQRFLTKSFFKSTFNVMLPRMVDYWRTLGGLDELKVKTKEENKDAR